MIIVLNVLGFVVAVSVTLAIVSGLVCLTTMAVTYTLDLIRQYRAEGGAK